MPATGNTRKTRLGSLHPSRRFAPARLWAAACGFALLFTASAFGQSTTKEPAAAPAPGQSQILARVEAQAQAYKDAIARIPLEVQETVREYDANGHLKKTRHSSSRYAFDATAESGQNPRGAVLSDGVTLPLIFLPGSIPHLTIHAETPKDGPWVVHFKSTPCNPPTLHRHWMSADVSSQCVEGKAFLDPSDGAITRIRMDMAGLPVFFRRFPLPVEVEILEIYNDATFRLLPARPGARPQLVPVESKYVIYTDHDRTVVDKVFRVLSPQPASPAPGSR